MTLLLNSGKAMWKKRTIDSIDVFSQSLQTVGWMWIIFALGCWLWSHFEMHRLESPTKFQITGSCSLSRTIGWSGPYEFFIGKKKSSEKTMSVAPKISNFKNIYDLLYIYLHLGPFLKNVHVKKAWCFGEKAAAPFKHCSSLVCCFSLVAWTSPSGGQKRELFEWCNLLILLAHLISKQDNLE